MHLPTIRLTCLVAALTLALAAPALADSHNSSHDSDDHGNKHKPNPCKQLGLQGDIDDHDFDGPCSAVLRQNEKFIQQDIQHLLVIINFLRKHPELKSHFLTLLSDPSGDNVQPEGDGNFRVTVPVNTPCPPDIAGCNPQPSTQTIMTAGLSTKLSGLYRSVLFASDRNAQLKLYTEAYNHLPQGFQIPGAQLPTPDSLSDASLTTVTNALKILGNAWQVIIPGLPLPDTPPDTSDCNGETGTTTQHALYGDRTGNSSSCKPSSTGLYGTLADNKFPLRKYLTCVKQQGARFTCHTFADTSAVEMKISQNHGIKVNLSEEDLMEHYRLVWSVGYMHESGDAYEELDDAIANNYFFPYENRWDYNPSYNRSFDSTTGVFHNSCDNYPNTEPGCSDSAPQAPGTCIGIALPIFFTITIPFPICNIHEAGVPESPWQPTLLTSFWNGSDTELSKEYMILSVAFNNAVVLGFNTTPRFDSAGSNNGYVVYDATDVMTNNGGHYVHVVGIAGNDELPEGAPKATGGGYFIVKNSWNSCFGDAGYVYLDFDYVKAVGWQGFSVSSVN